MLVGGIAIATQLVGPLAQPGEAHGGDRAAADQIETRLAPKSQCLG